MGFKGVTAMDQDVSHGTLFSLLSKCGLLPDQTPAPLVLPVSLTGRFPCRNGDYN